MIRLVHIAKAIGWLTLTLSLSSCLIYSNYDREVRIWDSASNRVASHADFRFSHATPAIYIPRSPDPVRAKLDDDGKATVRLPGVLGWVGTSQYSTLIEGQLIRDGGIAELRDRNADHKATTWKIQISIPKPENPRAQQVMRCNRR